VPDSSVGQPLPKDLEERLDRGKRRLDQIAPERNECLRFWRGDQYCFINKSNQLVAGETRVGTNGRPAHRPRGSHNILIDVVEREVAAATSRVPGYEVNPSTTDPEDISAARLSGKVARYGYEKWNLQDVTARAVELAVVADEAFVWPYWDPTVPPFIDREKGIGIGDVKFRVFNANQAYWEPGVRFEDSPWWAVIDAVPAHEIESMPGFLGGGELHEDANGADSVGDQRAQADAKLVLRTTYLERPCKDYPEGRMLVLANKRQVCKSEPYPCTYADGTVCPEPVLHKLSYIIDPANDRDMGLVRHCLDPLRTYLDCWNRQVQWKNMTIFPQWVVRNAQLLETRTDVPGKVYNLRGQGDVQVLTPPPIPKDLEDMKQAALAEIARICAQNDIPSQVEAGKAIASLIERDNQRRATFITRLATFHSRLMRAALALVAQYYTEPRLLKIRGRFGPEIISDFKGSDLRSQVDVTVLPGSITPYTREGIQAKLTWIAQTFPGYLQPEAAIAALDGGTGEKLIESYELDVARANEVIQQIKAGPDVFLNQPSRFDSKLQMDIPGWMPRSFDNIAVHKKVFADFMKTTDFSMSDPAVQEACTLYYDGLEQLEQAAAERQAIQQQQLAQGLGMANASRPQSPVAMPDVPGGSTPQVPQAPGLAA
jgi:hypothetical protein